MKLSLFLIFVVVVSSYGSDQKQVYCGRRLSNALANLCDYSILEKKSVRMDFQGTWPWLQQENAVALSRPRGKRDGIVEECCDKPCSINELLSYC